MGNRGNIRPRTRVGLKIFGSVLFFLGMINIMFSMKAGLRVQNFYIFLIVAGIVVFIIGSWDSWQDRGDGN